ncbi:MAG: type III pantothenate kinase [Tannerella sp.]|nr:type III pantothenate kinase [Tannerella sp.]
MNLIIEQGNTAVKAAVYDRGKIVTTAVYEEFGLSELLPFFEQYPLENGILSTVAKTDEAWIDCMNRRLKYFLFLDSRSALPIAIRYQTPERLGCDRIAVAAGAHFLCPGRDILVIDAGTAITYEIVEASGAYVGGNISPGMTTRFRALHQFTEKLPLVKQQDEVPLIGISTETAIVAGVVNGIVYEMDGYINELRKKYPDIFVFLTGGHSFYFERRLKNSIFAAINLVLVGLNRILEYNVEKQ